uniref:Remorin C-terminal domain-containing protein n=1 Tax=Lactuca sativa TaxID=4236 RepID=A0A9R1UPY6_LACSA|nr:hypothetical protein LSAT_V11C800425750 [Lactuca sativa]
MATEEVKKVEVEPECPVEPSPVAEVEEKAIVPVENPVTEEKPVDDTNSFAIIEKPIEDKTEEGSVHREVVLARVSIEKKDAQIKHGKKARNQKQRTTSSIGAWENSKKADLEAEQKKIKYIEKMKNQIALLHKNAEEKRAMTKAKVEKLF